MLSSLSYVRFALRAARSYQGLSRASINSLQLCKRLTTTHHILKDEDTVFTEGASSTEITPAEIEVLPIKDASSTVEKSVKVDVVGKYIEKFFQKARCRGCGAVFQSDDNQKPGFIIAAKNPSLQDNQTNVGPLKPVICERCFNMKYYNIGSQIVQSPNEVREFLGHIARRKGLILYMVDIMDLPGSLVPDILDIVGQAKRIIVVATKIDNIVADGNPHKQHEHLHSYVLKQCSQHGLQDANIKDVCLISVIKGFGIQRLVRQILKHWDDSGDIYLVGANNTGKTSLFNLLLDLTNVHQKNGDMLHRATVSKLPGTTLNLLRTPFGRWKLQKLKRRLQFGTEEYEKKIASQEEYGLDPEIMDKSETSYKDSKSRETSLSTSENQGNNLPEVVSDIPMKEHQPWLYDTPGIFKQNQVTTYLTLKELKLLHSNRWIVPRTYILKPGQAFLLGGLARVDYKNITRMSRSPDSVEMDTLTEANKSIFFTIFASPNLPIHVLNIPKVVECYSKHAGHELLQIPTGGSDRMKDFPGLKGCDFTVTGIGWKESAADVVLSNIGWVAVTAGQMADVSITAYTPNGVGVTLREPAMLPTSVNQRAKRGVRYQGHVNYSGYEGHRKVSPPLINLLTHNEEGVKQWLNEVKLKTKQQRALIKFQKIKKVIEKSLSEGDSALKDSIPGSSKATEKLAE